MTVVAIVVDKRKLKQKYSNPYHIRIKFGLERVRYLLTHDGQLAYRAFEGNTLHPDEGCEGRNWSSTVLAAFK